MEDIRNWPLMHGSLKSPDILDSVRQEGLRASEGKGNSYGYDKALGRTDNVFLSVAKLHCVYGAGEWVLIHPSILDRPGVQCVHIDIGDIWGAVKRCVFKRHVDKAEFPEYVLQPEQLLEIVNEVKSAVEKGIRGKGGDPDDFSLDLTIANRVFERKEFVTHYYPLYLLTPSDFYDELNLKYGEYSIEDFLHRDVGLGEEILVPDCVPPDYILGYYDGQWHQWSDNLDQKLQKRVDLLVDRFRNSRANRG